MKVLFPNSLLPGVAAVADPYRPVTAHVAPHVRRAVLHAIRRDSAAFYRSAAYLAGQSVPFIETLTGDHTGPCPLPSHPVPEPPQPGALSVKQRHARVAEALREVTNAPAGSVSGLSRGRPLRILHGDSGAGWRCTACGGGSPVQFLSRLFFLPAENSEAAAWNLAARMLGLDPPKIDAREWQSWDSARAHLEWGTALAYTRANLDKLRPLYHSLFPSWRDTEILQFPATGRGTWLAAYRVRGRLTQLEEIDFPAAGSDPAAARPPRRIRFHHWTSDQPSRLARSVTGVYPDTPGNRPAAPQSDQAPAAPAALAHLVQGPEQAASARRDFGQDVVIGVPYGPPGLGQAEVDALAKVERVYVWGEHTPAGRGFQNQMVRLLRACGIDARPVRWPRTGSLPRGYHLTDLLRDGGRISLLPDGTLQIHLPSRFYMQTTLPLAEGA